MKDIYLKFSGPDIKGESQDQDHTHWIEVNSWSHGIVQPKSATSSTAGGHTAERCEHGDMLFNKELDLVSPQLYQNCSAGQTFKEVQVDFMRADGDGKRIKYLEIKMKDVLVSHVDPAVHGEGLPQETFGLRYAAIQWRYTQQKVDGGQGGTSQGSWSLNKNTTSYTA